MATPSRTEQAAVAERGGAAPRILVVDDVAVNREILKRWLARRGFAITEAADGHEAIRIVEDGAVDLILLDIMMPNLDGTDVVRAIRRTRSKSDLPIVMVSAKCFSDDVAQSLDLGANAYVSKPVDFKLLLAVIEEQMLAKRATEAAVITD